MKTIFLSSLLLIGIVSEANMASPLSEGTMTSTVFSSHDVDVIRERIVIKIAKDFNSANYFIEYLIKTDTCGIQIPLLFHAQDYGADFKIFIDDLEVRLQEIPKQYLHTSNSPFENFANSFQKPYREGASETVLIFWEKNTGYNYTLSDLKYFELDLDSGEHHIEIEYKSEVWIDHSDWAKQYSFRYSLSPAKYWRSFGSIEIVLDATEFNHSVVSNFGKPTYGNLDSISVWNIHELPDEEFFQVTYRPEIPKLAESLINFGPFNLMLLIALLFFLIHLLFIRVYRKYSPNSKYSWVVILGSIVLPFFILLSYMYAHILIDHIIGEEAGRHHGYTFLMVIFYPLFMPIYWLIMWGFDKLIKFRISRQDLTRHKK